MVILYQPNSIGNDQNNIYAYHAVFASSFSKTLELTVGKLQQDDALLLAKLCYYAAGSLNGKAYIDLHRNMAQKKDLGEAIHMMIAEEKQAGLTPVQFFHGESTYAKALIHAKKGGV